MLELGCWILDLRRWILVAGHSKRAGREKLTANTEQERWGRGTRLVGFSLHNLQWYCILTACG
jgi:hypothetical protein